jgi:DNA-binding response OmpR family regulator
MSKKILLVDDDPDFVKQNKLLLERSGFAVQSAGTEKEAMEIINNAMPDLVIVDLMLERADGGFSLSYHIKKKSPQTPVILVTSVVHDYGLDFNADTDEERSWIKADMVVDKPIRFEQLLADIKGFLKE